jgi:hypothetical protein
MITCHLSLTPIPKGKTMSRRQSCADNLVLLGEMLEAATEYISLCDDSLKDDDAPMVQLAYQEISPLRNRAARLCKKLEELEKRVGTALARLSGLAPKRRAARAT